MELVVRKNDLLRELQLFQGIVERKNTIPILANVLMEAKGDEVRLLATDLEVALRSQCAGHGHERRVADAAGEEALRDRQVAARNRHSHRGRQERREGRRRSVRLADADAAARGFSDAARSGRRRRRDAAARSAEGDGREDAVRDHRRRHAVFPERRAVRAEAGVDEPGGHRRPSPGAGHGRRDDGKATKDARRESRRFCRRRRWANSAGC